MSSSLDDILAAIDAKIGAVDQECARFEDLRAERRRLVKARTALTKAFRGTAATTTAPAAPKAGRQARPSQPDRGTASRDAEILAALDRPMSSTALAGRLRTTPGALLHHLQRLREAGQVTRTGQTSQTRWSRT